MRAILFDSPGPSEHLYNGQYPDPIAGEGELLVKVRATALNRADTLQRKGKYPPPPGASPVLGLEMAGEVVGLGQNAVKWPLGSRVMALLPGGGYAEYVTIPQDMAIPIPESMSFEEAAAVPEVFLTAYQALVWLARVKSGETVLIHAGGSGVGTAATQLAKALGAEVVVTASAPKHSICKQMGASLTIDYKSENFQDVIAHHFPNGVNIILDFLAAPYFSRNLASLGTDGRMVLLALMGGTKVQEVDLGQVLRKRLQIIGSTLRARTLGYKEDLTRDFWTFAEKHFLAGRLRPVIDSIVSWEEVVSAHNRMEQNLNAGKIVMKIE